MAEQIAIARTGLPQDSLKGKVAVITGGGRGLGKELARALAWLGANVVIAEIDPETGAEVERTINRENPTARSLYIQTDVADEDSMKAMSNVVIDTFGKADILVNNAIIIPVESVIETPMSVWDQAYAVITRGTVLGIKLFVPQMLAQKQGVVVSMSTGSGLPWLSAYAGLKTAAISITSSLATELGNVKKSGVSVFNIFPGRIDTPAMASAVPQLASKYDLSPEEYIAKGKFAEYEGLMPAGDAAVAVAYAIVHASEYHGHRLSSLDLLKQIGWDFPTGIT